MMKFIKHTIFLVGAMVSTANSFAAEPPSALCSTIRTKLDRTIAAIKPLSPLAQARRLDAFDHANENPETCNADRMNEAQDAAELQLVQLDANGTKIRPEKVFRCATIEGGYKHCNSAYAADDTASSRERIAGHAPVPQVKTIRLESKWKGAKLRCTYVLSFNAVAPVCSNATIIRRPPRGSILVAIYSVGGYTPLRKYVWSVD